MGDLILRCQKGLQGHEDFCGEDSWLLRGSCPCCADGSDWECCVECWWRGQEEKERFKGRGSIFC